MVSIIICSKYQQLDKQLLLNIQNTIGTAYEVVHIDNSQHQYSIFEAYNLGVSRAKGEYLCFMHEDVLFHSNNWGRIVEDCLVKSNVGAIGLAGSNVITKNVDWRFYYQWSYMYLIQGSNTIEEHAHYYHPFVPQKQKNVPLRQVATLDGVWICIRKDLFKQIRFDDTLFHDFHLYDTDICMQINMIGKEIFMTYDVLLEHKSEGGFSESFKESLNVFSKKWDQQLPVVRGADISLDAISQMLPEAESRFEERMKIDAIAAELRRLLAQKATGTAVRDFTEQEKAFMDANAYNYRKRCIKDRNLTSDRVKALMDEYYSYPYARNKGKLRYKYFWYRVIAPLFH